MVNLARRAEVKITINGKNVKEKLAPFLIDFSYTDKTGGEVDDIAITLDDRELNFEADWLPEKGDSIECSIISYYWDSFSGQPKELRCGKFEVDEIEARGMPEVIVIKAVSSLNASIRRELHDKTWTKVSFYKICQEIAGNRGLQLKFVADDFMIDTLDQHAESDLKFISRLCDDNGCKLKIQDNTLVIYDEMKQENQQASFTISKYELSPQYSFRTQAYDIYKDAKVSYFDPRRKKSSSATVSHNQVQSSILKDVYGTITSSKKSKKTKAHYSGYTYLDKASASGGGKTLVIRQKVHSLEEAERLAKSRLRAKNKGEWVASFSKSGDLRLIAGINITIDDFGKFGGLFAIDETTHSINRSGGYTTSAKAHRVL